MSTAQNRQKIGAEREREKRGKEGEQQSIQPGGHLLFLLWSNFVSKVRKYSVPYDMGSHPPIVPQVLPKVPRVKGTVSRRIRRPLPL